MKKIVAVMPAYNEENRISRVIESARKFVEDVIVVDDHSRDNTARVSKGKGAHVIELSDNMGVGCATRIGCDYAVDKGADIIVTIDADGQHNPYDIPKLLEPLLADKADIVFGIRPRDIRMPLEKRIGNALLCLIARILFKSNIQDTLTGFHAFKSSCYHSLRWDSPGYGVVSEIAYRTIKHKLRHKQILVETIYNDKKNGMKKRDGIKAIFLMFKWKMIGD
jgi:UDP-N-acetylglucosamine---dolichyl-phosphate N-acetylglucosaminyltransferase